LKLLLDENLSPRLAALIGDLYPESCHVEDCGLINAPDDAVWRFAAENGFAIVSKDSDFSERSVLHGSPPKVIWLRVGNCTTDRAGFVLRDAFARIQAFLSAEEESCLVLSVASRMPVRGVEQ
jgi:predicted nuclease of predicted toxin-antitoxin system